jgi:hypothetical protein
VEGRVANVRANADGRLEVIDRGRKLEVPALSSSRIVSLGVGAEAVDALSTVVRTGAPRTFLVPLGPDEADLVVMRRFSGAPGSAAVTLVGEFADRDLSEVSLTITADSVLAGTIQLADTVLEVERTAPGRPLVVTRRQVQGALPPEGAPRRPPAAPPASAPPGPAGPPRPSGDRAPGTSADASDVSGPAPAGTVPCPPATVRVLVVFTQGGAAGRNAARLQARAAAGVASINQALSASQIPHQVELAGVRVLGPGALPATDSLNTELTMAQQMPQLRAWRRETQADLVSVWADTTGVVPRRRCGLGYVITDVGAHAEYGVSVVPDNCALGELSFAHEVGHNLGMEHDRANTTSPGIDPFSYGFQHFAPAPAPSFRDVMAYPCSQGGCGRQRLYSSPRSTFMGVPTGVDHGADPGRAADNARTAAWTMCRVASWDRKN